MQFIRIEVDLRTVKVYHSIQQSIRIKINNFATSRKIYDAKLWGLNLKINFLSLNFLSPCINAESTRDGGNESARGGGNNIKTLEQSVLPPPVPRLDLKNAATSRGGQGHLTSSRERRAAIHTAREHLRSTAAPRDPRPGAGATTREREVDPFLQRPTTTTTSTTSSGVLQPPPGRHQSRAKREDGMTTARLRGERGAGVATASLKGALKGATAALKGTTTTSRRSVTPESKEKKNKLIMAPRPLLYSILRDHVT